MYTDTRPPFNPSFRECPVSACEISYDNTQWKEADLLVLGTDSLHPKEPRPTGQGWLFHTYESPGYHPLQSSLGNKVRWSNLDFYFSGIYFYLC